MNYLDAVVMNLTKMKCGEIKILNKNHEKYDNFVSTVKQIIDERIDTLFGFEVSFNSDYTKLFKHGCEEFKKFEDDGKYFMQRKTKDEVN